VYKESLDRVLQNVLIFLDVLKPRNFDSDDLTKELPLDSTYVFWHLAAQRNASEVGKLMIKDFKDQALSEAFSSLRLLFEML
jgi:hypothetical protein